MDGGRPAGGYQTSVFRAQPSENHERKIQRRNRPPVSCSLCRTRKPLTHLDLPPRHIYCVSSAPDNWNELVMGLVLQCKEEIYIRCHIPGRHVALILFLVAQIGLGHKLLTSASGKMR
ncbi:uncharacterized protein BCR38DRAFT_444899 [Pseudomassariella vexata]|uniref:Uncharacterized protein n=1 Tax=Pseudomassariella vexata TaxID=1141098 RepID=A0A1Y2DJY7_9PEZI|nr:uncharacterized protein BCR38DRAFT_444899 [Pseudomassariella vexata]ORY59563.1 hypothetical protein BCR38DRAFT_444899 [Pseudomassariella vexata]